MDQQRITIECSDRTANFAFADALFALEELGHKAIAKRLKARWKDVPITFAGSMGITHVNIGWYDRFIDMRFSQQETTEWETLVDTGMLPDLATTEIVERRKHVQS